MRFVKDIPGYENLYAIRSDGEIYSYNAKKVLTQSVNYLGYPIITLSKSGVSKTYKVHRLVAQTFLANPHELPQVDHIDENKTHNDLANLRWCSGKENSQWYAENNPEVVKAGRVPKDIRVNGKRYESCYAAAKFIATETGKNQKTISKELRRIRSGQREECIMYGTYDIQRN